jgi:GH15 family glucan-1,4-alpha-glucosidase
MKRRYREDTVILETERYNETGRVRVTDFLAWHGGASALICIVEELKGSVPMELSMRLRFRYGQVSPWVQAHKRGMIAQMGPDRVTLDSPLDLSIDSDTATAAFMIRKGESVAFICSYSPSTDRLPRLLSFGPLHEENEKSWTDWIGRFNVPCHWPSPYTSAWVDRRGMTFN